MKISIPRASYASYAFGKYVEQVRDAEELRLHIRECNSVQALDNLTKKHYNLALIRMEDKYEEYYYSIIHLRGLEYEKIMDFQILPVRQSGISVYQLDIRFQIFISGSAIRSKRWTILQRSITILR